MSSENCKGLVLTTVGGRRMDELLLLLVLGERARPDEAAVVVDGD